VVFSFDGDAAGRRAATRALEASLAHATDTRTVRFLFLPPEHDPDSFVREYGAQAFERCIAEAVPLSRQIAEVSAQGCDLDTAEGRSRLLANARPLWAALPDGALKLQMLGELALLARIESGELLALWSPSATPGKTQFTLAPRSPRRASGRLSRGTANLLDRALWLLLQRCELWAALDGESHDILAGQAAPYDMFFGCIEKTLLEHGPMASAAVLAELRARADTPAGEAVLARIAAFHDPDPQTNFAHELEIVLDRLRLQAAEDELKMLFESGVLTPDAQQRGKQLMALQARLKSKFARGHEQAAT
jgi:DNA primase